MLLSPKLAAYLIKRQFILLTMLKVDKTAGNKKCPELRCASMLNNNEFDLVYELTKGDQPRERVSYKTCGERSLSGKVKP